MKSLSGGIKLRTRLSLPLFEHRLENSSVKLFHVSEGCAHVYELGQEPISLFGAWIHESVCVIWANQLWNWSLIHHRLLVMKHWLRIFDVDSLARRLDWPSFSWLHRV
jgi:hypothetical protein